jgi:2-amino-4-hydroxy-6-hydroxymethyldihydropteridine diphosphokinase
MAEGLHKGKKSVNVFLLLGANLGDTLSNIEKAGALIHAEVAAIGDASSVYKTEPWEMESDDWFLNQVLKIETDLSAMEILSKTKKIEQSLGRRRFSEPGYQSRIIDIDILYYGTAVMESNELTIPHPRMTERRFTMEPLVEIDPAGMHPGLKKTNSELLNLINDETHIQLL